MILDFAELCNGSTAVSDTVCQGSNPCSAAKKRQAALYELPAVFRFHCFFAVPVLPGGDKKAGALIVTGNAERGCNELPVRRPIDNVPVT